MLSVRYSDKCPPAGQMSGTRTKAVHRADENDRSRRHVTCEAFAVRRPLRRASEGPTIGERPTTSCKLEP